MNARETKQEKGRRTETAGCCCKILPRYSILVAAVATELFCLHISACDVHISHNMVIKAKDIKILLPRRFAVVLLQESGWICVSHGGGYVKFGIIVITLSGSDRTRRFERTYHLHIEAR